MCIRDRVWSRGTLSIVAKMFTTSYKVSIGMISYTDVEDDVMCIEYKVVLHDLQDTDDPWFEDTKPSPNCFLVKLYNALDKDDCIE